MIIKRNFNPLRVVHYVQWELSFASISSVGVYVLYSQQLLGFTLPFSISAILGSALAIFIAFRNNSSYSRWWEARTLWGGIVNSSRVLARLVITFADSHAHQSNYDKSRSEQFKREMIYRTIAWAHALRLSLRNQNQPELLKAFLSQPEWEQVVQTHHKPNCIHLLSGQKIYEAMANGILAGFDSFQLEGQLLALANYQGGCERIKNTPLLRQYDFFTRVFLYTFMALLPLTLMGDFAKLHTEGLMIPVSIILSFVFAIIGKVGEVNEDPFENSITDVPLTALCNTIERDLREMLGEKELPEKTQVENGFLY
jgi:putative membrane protein